MQFALPASPPLFTKRPGRSSPAGRQQARPACPRSENGAFRRRPPVHPRRARAPFRRRAAGSMFLATATLRHCRKGQT
ncbi:hypothetical protein DZD18_02300 [Rhodobacteraceae bacterium W635]|nr:hypothetical protein DZD18_02300 [Rhodobacteraceae bacterium W635]